MREHIYAFGSICRGEFDSASDVDLLACLSKPKAEIDPKKFSIYTHERIEELWADGNPFAWHLHLESKLLYSSDGEDFILNLGEPSEYVNAPVDCLKFKKLFLESYDSLVSSSDSAVFHLSCMFLATRNFATCYSLSKNSPVFSRNSPLLISEPLSIEESTFELFSRARILSTRGYGEILSNDEINLAKSSSQVIINWMDRLFSEGN
ncbi:nucleotidyltransferase domain-containing protein [Endozoicomonas sp. ALC020]|uniref:nucleotidyltransferase domain-containing protein n=1 Tax=unclassified Endozoicomonas TaxID=2644528 RepID=UPI003BAF4B04